VNDLTDTTGYSEPIIYHTTRVDVTSENMNNSFI